MIYADSQIKTIGKGWNLPTDNPNIKAGIDPFSASQVNPASYDLTLYPRLKVAHAVEDQRVPLDLRDVNGEYLSDLKLYGQDGYTLKPGEFVLGSTVEYIELGNDVAARVEGKSSLARMGLAVHVTGGFIDPGFRGQITLEIVNLFHRPLIIYPNMRIAQIAFSPIKGEVESSYARVGHYQGQQGPTLSRYRTDPIDVVWFDCWGCDWTGTSEDWRVQVGQERCCVSEGCSDYQRTCPSDHCLECGAAT